MIPLRRTKANQPLLLRAARVVWRRLPARLQALADYYLRPNVRKEWGGPFNGQEGRQEIVRDLLRALPFEAIVETGTYRGTTTEYLLEEANVPVHSVEMMPRFYHYARRRLQAYPRVEVVLGDSRSFLADLAERSSFPRELVFFYLDAHWYEDLPLLEEVEIIQAKWRCVVIMIDDFEVPSDPGYRFDDYGPGKRLGLDLLGPLEGLGLVAFFPARPAEEETGARRGTVVLADRSAVPAVNRVESLRRFDH